MESRKQLRDSYIIGFSHLFFKYLSHNISDVIGIIAIIVTLLAAIGTRKLRTVCFILCAVPLLLFFKGYKNFEQQYADESTESKMTEMEQKDNQVTQTGEVENSNQIISSNTQEIDEYYDSQNESSMLEDEVLLSKTENDKTDPYISVMLGRWYDVHEGYMIAISGRKNNQIVNAHITDYDSRRSESRGGKFEANYELIQAHDDLYVWYEVDGAFELKCYPDDNDGTIWITIRKDNTFFQEGEGPTFQFWKVTDEKKKEWEENISTDNFHGTWMDDQSGEIYTVELVAGSEDIYGYKDYIIKDEKGNAIIMKSEYDKLKQCVFAYTSDYYLLESPIKLALL